MKLVIFDVDGTLVDSQADILSAMATAFDDLGLAVPSDDAVRGIVGLSLPQAMAVLAPGLSRHHAALVDGYKSAYFALRAQKGAGGSPLFAGARAALDRLAADPSVVLAIATGKSRRGLDGLLAAHDLTGLFATPQVADDHPSKPDPSMIRACLAETGIGPRDAVIVGDTEFDMAMGRAAGVAAIGVTWGYHPPARLAAADLCIDDFAALDGALRRIWGRA